MNSHRTEHGDRLTQSCFADRQPITWITTVADQIAREAGLARTEDIEDLVILTYVGLLDSPHPADLCRSRLLQRCRRSLVTWAWEQGLHQEPIPTTAQRTG